MQSISRIVNPEVNRSYKALRTWLIPLLLFASFSSPPAFADERIDCSAGTGRAERELSGFLVQVSPAPDHDAELGLCQAIIRTAEGRAVFQFRDHRITINDATGKDIDGDGKPDVVIEGDSGGSHCCWTYWIVSLRDSPRLMRRIYNERGLGFEDLDHNGRIEIVTRDGAFDYFDELSHVESPFPLVVLRLHDGQLDRVNAEYWPLYQEEIDEARSRLKPQCAELFRHQGFRPESKNKGCDRGETKQVILRIVLQYLYGGREEKAWKALKEYWPPSDVERIRKLILATARRSFLGDTRNPQYGLRN